MRASDRVIRVAIDAMSGYNSPEAPIEAAAELSLVRGEPLHLILVGDAHLINAVLAELEHNPERLSVVHSAHALRADQSPSRERLSGTSIERATRLLAEDRADALVSAANGGAVVLAAHDHVPTIPGIEHGAIAAVLPTRRRRGEKEDPFCLLLDVGATFHPSAEDLRSFGVMGAAYARAISKNDCPRVALLSASPEPTIGPANVVRAHDLLEEGSDEEHYAFIGNIEGHLLPTGEADVVVCDGFTGAILVRLIEGIAETALELARNAYDTKIRWRLALSMLSSGLEQLKHLIDWEEYGGAPLLGFSRPIIMTHGNSGTRAFRNAIKVAAKTVREDVIPTIRENLL